MASPSFGHYSQIWARHTAISSLGALASGEDSLIEIAIASMQSLGGAISSFGQIPAVVRPDGDTPDGGEGGVVDATAWYVILTAAIDQATGNPALARRHWSGVSHAMNWLAHQDVTGSGLISAAPATDWMDSSLVRSGRTLHLNVLYTWAAGSAEKLARAVAKRAPVSSREISWRVNALFWPSEDIGQDRLLLGPGPLPDRFPHSATVEAHLAAARRDRGHYVSHVVHAHYDEHCDVLGNLLATVSGVADHDRSRSILDHLAARRVDRPYPSRTWPDPVDTSRPSAMFVPGVEEHVDRRWHNAEYSYHNGGIWPFVGGFHATALALHGRPQEAREMIERLAGANRVAEWGFHEWLHGSTGEPHGARDQTWNAAMFLLAVASLEDPESVRRLLG